VVAGEARQTRADALADLFASLDAAPPPVGRQTPSGGELPVSGAALTASLDELFANMSGSDSSSFIKLLAAEPGQSSPAAPRPASPTKPAPTAPPQASTPAAPQAPTRRSLLDEVFELRPDRGPNVRPPSRSAPSTTNGPSTPPARPAEDDKPPLEL
jgi:hypothetical protein